MLNKIYKRNEPNGKKGKQKEKKERKKEPIKIIRQNCMKYHSIDSKSVAYILLKVYCLQR